MRDLPKGVGQPVQRSVGTTSASFTHGSTKASRSSRRTTTSPPRRHRGWGAFLVAAFVATTVGIGLEAAEPGPALSGDASTMEVGIDAATLAPGSMYNVVDQVGARALWAEGITGAGVNVAVIDTGVAPIDSLGNVVAVADLSAEAADPSTAFIDTYGHGTAMAGIIAGAEPGADPATAAGQPEKFLGVAPDAGIVSVKISGRDGASDPSDVVAGVDWVIANAERLDIKVISLSYDSGSSLPYTADPLTAAVERAWNAGITVVAMAGNEGATAERLASPGIDPFVITVAGAEATETGLSIADFSSAGDGVRNPDVAAPGAHIESLRAPGSDADLNHSDLGTVDGAYSDEMLFKGTGTSQATAVTAGVVALLNQKYPDLAPDQYKALLTSTAQPIAGSETDAGANLVRADLAAVAPIVDVTQNWAPADSTGRRRHERHRRLHLEHLLGRCFVGRCFVGRCFVGRCFVGRCFVGRCFVGRCFVGRCFVGRCFVGRCFVGRCFVGRCFVGRCFVGRCFVGRCFVGRCFVGRCLVGRCFVGRCSRGAVLRGAEPRWGGASWGGASWGGASWGGASWGGASWGGASWGGASGVEPVGWSVLGLTTRTGRFRNTGS